MGGPSDATEALCVVADRVHARRLRRRSEPAEPAREQRGSAGAKRCSIPMTSTIGRAQGVQQTVDEQAAEQRRRIEDAER